MTPMVVTLTALLLVPALPVTAAGKQRVIVLTDITNEPDDEESMVRFLMYSNEYDVEGLIATTSVWLRDKVRPEEIRKRVLAYAQVRTNLRRHAWGYPSAEKLLRVIKSGRAEFGMKGVGEGKNSEGSRHIISVVDRHDERPVWICVWGGANCLAQALWEVRKKRSTGDVEKFVSKLRVYSISDQDDSGRWMRTHFPKLFYIVSPSSVGPREYYKATWTGISGDRQYRNGPMDHFDLVDNPWLEENIIRDHGPLGALYPKLSYIMEGDTPSFLGLIHNGLGSYISPAYGGWGGRYVLYQSYGEARPIWTNVAGARDTVRARDGREYTSAQATIWRWREAYQHDFAARMDWCVADTFNKANHNPRVIVDHDRTKDVLERKIKAGEKVTLDASASTDPDGNRLSYHWFHYAEAEGYRVKKTVSITGADQPKATVTIKSADPGTKIHVILEAKDDGEPSLYSYRRVIFEVE